MRLPARRRAFPRQTPAAGRRPAAAGANRRSANRPAPQRRHPAPAGAGRPAPAPPATAGGGPRSGRLTTRAALLGLAVCAVVLMLAYPLREYLAQRNQISHLRAMQAQQRSQVVALELRRRQWQDPAFVKAQARKRLQYVMPGEVGYVIIDPGRQRAPKPTRSALTVAGRSGPAAPWYSQLWGSVRAADGGR